MTALTRAALLVVLVVIAGCAKSPLAADADGGGGASATTDCPKDLLAARGTSCAPDGKTCGTSSAAFTHFLMCSRGKWTEMEAPPPPPPPPGSP